MKYNRLKRNTKHVLLHPLNMEMDLKYNDLFRKPKHWALQESENFNMFLKEPQGNGD